MLSDGLNTYLSVVQVKLFDTSKPIGPVLIYDFYNVNRTGGTTTPSTGHQSTAGNTPMAEPGAHVYTWVT